MAATAPAHAVAPPPAAPPAERPYAALTTLIDAHDLGSLTIDAGDRCGSGEPRWTIASAHASCLVTAGELRCVAAATPEAACATAPAMPAIEAPAWAQALAAQLRATPGAEWLRMTPIPGGPRAFAVDQGETSSVLAQVGGRWLAFADASEAFRRPARERVLDASLLAHRPAIAVVTYRYDGGSEMGQSRTDLDVLCADGDALQACGSLQIGQLSWYLAAEERAKFPGAESSLRKRPHVEVELAPELIAPDRLRLRIAIEQRHKDATELFDGDALVTHEELRARAGTYRLEDGVFVRVP